MRILLISSAFSGLTQRFYSELEDAGYWVAVELHLGATEQLLQGVTLAKPDLIICPFLTRKLPKEIYENYKCLIVHPGIKGDRGPSSLDWAIQGGETEWGVSLLEAQEEMDSGAIWAHKSFPVRFTTKSSLFYREVTQAAVDCLWEVLTYIDAPDFKPEAQDYSRTDYRGKLLPMMRQEDRAIDWQKHSTEEILRRIHAADGSPGVLDEMYGKPFYLYNAHKASGLHGKPGAIIAVANHAICRATVDGAIWIGHLKPKPASGNGGIKLPAAMALKDLLPGPPVAATFALKGLLSKTIKTIAIDHGQAGQQLPCQEVWYDVEGDVAAIHFPFHNGGMSTEQCRLLLSVYQHVATLPVKVIVLAGGEDNWSNGIHLNHIEAADDPSRESWLNINAIDDLVRQIVTTLDKLTIAAVSGNAGAGGAILALAADQVFAREGVIFNPHYKNMGELYGSEYWTYLLPKRVGQAMATELTEKRLPLSAKKAWQMGLIDKVLDRQHQIFSAQIKHLAHSYATDQASLQAMLNDKATVRCRDEAVKPLAAYRKFELTQMYANFYGNDDYHQARQHFVYKTSSGERKTPANIAQHRQEAGIVKLTLGSMPHCVWQDHYALGNALMDSEHKDCFVLADKLLACTNNAALQNDLQALSRHVQEHFNSEQALMTAMDFRGLSKHADEHQAMLDKLLEIDRKNRNNAWQPQDLLAFMDMWTDHIVSADMAFNRYMQNRKGAAA